MKNTDILHKDIDLHDWEDFLAFLTAKSVEEATKPCKQAALDQIKEHGEDVHPGCVYADNLCASIASQINQAYPDIEVSWFINCTETSLNLSCDGEIEKISGLYDYLGFLNMLTGLDGLYDIIEAAYDYDLADATEAEAKWINSSETLKLIRSIGVDEIIEEFVIADDAKADEILTNSGCRYTIDDYPQKTLAVALIVKALIDELAKDSTTKLSCSESKFAFVVDVELKNGSQHRITCFDDMSKLMRESVTL